jgi:hypothetical protein
MLKGNHTNHIDADASLVVVHISYQFLLTQKLNFGTFAKRENKTLEAPSGPKINNFKKAKNIFKTKP